MTLSITVAEVKRRFAEVLGKVRYQGERFVVMRRKQPMAALVQVEDLRRLETLDRAKPEGGPQGPPRGLLSAIGSWAEFDELDQIVEEIYRAREGASDRSVPPLS